MPLLQELKNEQANRRFLGLVEKHRCIWDREVDDFNYKPSTDLAWNEIAKEMGDTTKECQTHWRNIKRAFTRSIKVTPKGTFQRSQYYLSSYLEFLRPHLISGDVIESASSSTTEATKDDEEDNVSIISMTDIEIKEEPNDSSSEGINTTENIEQVLLDIIKMESDDLSNPLSDSQLNTIDSRCNTSVKRKREQKPKGDSRSKEMKKGNASDVQPSLSLADANRKFFESLVPFIDEMNAQQNRRFRREVMCLIDDVLDNRDLEE